VKFPGSITVITIFLLYSCNGDQANVSENETSASIGFKWIEGKYVVVNDQSGFYSEEWIKTDPDNYHGVGYFLTRDCVDTLLSIKMRLMHEQDKTILFYDVKDQKKKTETEYTLTKGENNIYVFENPFRDFPSIMQYKIIGDSVIEVTQRGFYANKEKVIDYRATKIN
jgi:hypothetical protein